jgi:hypothetical protein
VHRTSLQNYSVVESARRSSGSASAVTLE